MDASAYRRRGPLRTGSARGIHICVLHIHIQRDLLTASHDGEGGDAKPQVPDGNHQIRMGVTLLRCLRACVCVPLLRLTLPSTLSTFLLSNLLLLPLLTERESESESKRARARASERERERESERGRARARAREREREQERERARARERERERL